MMHNSATDQNTSETPAQRRGAEISLPPQEVRSAVLENSQPISDMDSSGEGQNIAEPIQDFSYPNITPAEMVELSLLGHEINASKKQTIVDFKGERQDVFLRKHKLVIDGLGEEHPLIIDAYNAQLPKPLALFLAFRVQQAGFKTIDNVIRSIISPNLLAISFETWKQYNEQLSAHDTIEYFKDSNTCQYTYFVNLSEKTLYTLSVDIVKKPEGFVLQKPDGKPYYKFYEENLPSEYDCIKQFLIPDHKLDDENKALPFNFLSETYNLDLMSVQQLPSKLDQKPQLIQLRPADAQEGKYYIWGMNAQGVWEYCLLDHNVYPGVDFNHDSIHLSKNDYPTLYREIQSKQAHCSNKHLCEIFREAQRNNTYSKITYPAYNSAEAAGLDKADWPLDEHLISLLSDNTNSDNANDTSQNSIQTQLAEIRNEPNPYKIISKLHDLKNDIAKQPNNNHAAKTLIEAFVRKALTDEHILSRLNKQYRSLTKGIIGLSPAVAAELDIKYFMIVLSDEKLRKKLIPIKRETGATKSKFQELCEKYQHHFEVIWFLRSSKSYRKLPKDFDLRTKIRDLRRYRKRKDLLRNYIFHKPIDESIRRRNLRALLTLEATSSKKYQIPCTKAEDLYELICLAGEDNNLTLRLLTHMLQYRKYNRHKADKPSLARMVKRLLSEDYTKDDGTPTQQRAMEILKEIMAKNPSFMKAILESKFMGRLNNEHRVQMALLNETDDEKTVTDLLKEKISLANKDAVKIALKYKNKPKVYQRLLKNNPNRFKFFKTKMGKITRSPEPWYKIADFFMRLGEALLYFCNPKKNYVKNLSDDDFVDLTAQGSQGIDDSLTEIFPHRLKGVIDSFCKTDTTPTDEIDLKKLNRFARLSFSQPLALENAGKIANVIIDKIIAADDTCWSQLKAQALTDYSSILDVLKNAPPDKIKQLSEERRRELIPIVFNLKTVPPASLVNYFFLLLEDNQVTPQEKAALLDSNPTKLRDMLRTPKPAQLEKLLNDNIYETVLKNNPVARTTFLASTFRNINNLDQTSEIRTLFDSLKAKLEKIKENEVTAGEAEQPTIQPQTLLDRILAKKENLKKMGAARNDPEAVEPSSPLNSAVSTEPTHAEQIPDSTDSQCEEKPSEASRPHDAVSPKQLEELDKKQPAMGENEEINHEQSYTTAFRKLTTATNKQPDKTIDTKVDNEVSPTTETLSPEGHAGAAHTSSSASPTQPPLADESHSSTPSASAIPQANAANSIRVGNNKFGLLYPQTTAESNQPDTATTNNPHKIETTTQVVCAKA